MNYSVNYKLKYLNNKKLYNDYKQQDSSQDGGLDFFSSSSSKKTSNIKQLLIKVIENAYDNDRIDEIIQKKLDKKDEKDYKIEHYIYVQEVLKILTQIFFRQHGSKIIEGKEEFDLDKILKDLIEVQESERKFVQSNFPTRRTFINKYQIKGLGDKAILHEVEKEDSSKNESESKIETTA